MPSTDAPRAAPYPSDVRAKGWRFELDYERIQQSDTWGLAAEAPMAQHALLMMWFVAWTQVPCGSMPNDEAVIRAKCGIPAKSWAALRPFLMRGWWLAADGRLYHEVLTERVGEMLEYRRKESERRNRNRRGSPASVPQLSRGTDAGQLRDSRVTDVGHTPESGGVPGTGTGTGTINAVITHHPRSTREGGGESAKPTKAGEVCRAIKAKGVADVNPSHPVLLEYIAKGVTVDVFEAAAETCAKARPPKGMAYLLGIVKRQLGEAAEVAVSPAFAAGAWDANRASIEAAAAGVGIEPWDEHDLSPDREMFSAYTERVRKALEINLARGVA